MTMPGFAAEAALYEIRNWYRMGLTQSALVGTRGAVPQQNILEELEPLGYACAGQACVCTGAADCLSCAINKKCKGDCTCSDTSCACVPGV